MSTLDQITLTAPDISCGHCVATVQNEVGALPGVESVQASAETKQILIAFDANQVSLGRIKETLDEAGYPVAE
ncbi:MAG: heavy-metal-associated domain-containing protein [Thermomicrobiales bacterium]